MIARHVRKALAGTGIPLIIQNERLSRMRAPTAQPEGHRTHRIGWLRAAVLGANDGMGDLSWRAGNGAY